MNLRKHCVNLSFDTQISFSQNPPYLLTVTIVPEIRKHENKFHLSPQRELIVTTNTFLKRHRAAESLHSSIDTRKSEALSRKRVLTSLRNRKENRANLIKKQVELFNEINLSSQRQQIKRYQEEILQEEVRIQATLAQHSIKRTWLTTTPKASSISKPKQSSKRSPPNLTTDNDTLENEGEPPFDKCIFPSRRFTIQGSRGKVSPWQVSPNLS